MYWGRRIQADSKLKAFAKRTGKLKAPPLAPRLAIVWSAFWELNSCRQAGMTLGPIPWTAIDRWAESEGLADRERFRRLIRSLDIAFVEAADEKADG